MEENLEKTGTETTEPVLSKRAATLPTDQVNTAALALHVATNWQGKPEFANLSLSQIKSSDFLLLAQRLSDNVSRKKTLLGVYKQQTLGVKDAAKEIKENTKVLKDYLFEQFKKDAKRHYTSFGFIHKRNAYVLPRDYDNLAQVLRSFCDNIQLANYSFLQHKTFGKTYWEATRDGFQANWNASKKQASDLADLTRAIEKDMVEVKKILTLLRRRIKDDFASDHESYWRSIGLLRETF